MRNTGNRFIPGIRIEVKEEEPEEEVLIFDNSKTSSSPGNGTSAGNGILDKLVGIEVTTEEIRLDDKANIDADANGDVNDDDDEVEETFVVPTGLRKLSKKSVGEEPVSEPVLTGTDWESVNYSLDKLACTDEVTGLEVTDRFIIVQFYIEPAIDVFDRNSRQFLFRLEGHEYGGHCLQTSPLTGLLYSASMDFSVKSWNLEQRKLLDSKSDHCDYVESVVVYPVSEEAGDLVATGGRGDKSIFVYEASHSGKLTQKHKLEGHGGWVVQMVILQKDDSLILISGSEDATIRIWDLDLGYCQQVLEQDAGISCLLMSPRSGYQDRLVFFGDQEGKLSYLDLDTDDVIHLLPNILIGTGKYCRSSKYHDKAVDTAHLTDNGYLITGSTGSKFVKIWKMSQGEELESTEVKELQILRDHTDFLTIIKVHDGTIFSSCSDGQVYLHQFPADQPHYDMAETENSTSIMINQNNGSVSVAADPERPTEICEGPKRCKTGKTGLVKSSSSFQVSFQLKPSICSVDSKIRIPKPPKREEVIFEADEDEWDPEKDSDVEEEDDEYEVVYVTETESEDESDE